MLPTKCRNTRCLGNRYLEILGRSGMVANHPIPSQATALFSFQAFFEKG